MEKTEGHAPSAAVIGAGLSGLTAAFRLQQAGWSVKVLEKTDHVGGRVRTIAKDGFLLDVGATGLAESYDAYLSLVADVGLRSHIVPAAPVVGIVRDGTIHHLRLDRIMRSGATTRLLSVRAKARTLKLFGHVARAKIRGQLNYNDMSKAGAIDTETAAQFAARVLDQELSDYLCEPVVRMMLIADADDVSVVELLSGVGNIFSTKICSLLGGQGHLPETVAAGLDVELDADVTRVDDAGGHVAVTWTSADGSERTERFDAAVISTPLQAAARICPDRSAQLQPLADALQYTQCLSVAVATDRPTESGAMVVQFPAREERDVALMFLNHNKASDRTPPGHGLVECCWSARASAELIDAPDEEIVRRTIETVERFFPELRGHVLFTHVTRWREALPHTTAGSYRHIARFNEQVDARSRIQFAADYMSAAGQNTAVSFGTRAARTLDAAYGAQTGLPSATSSNRKARA